MPLPSERTTFPSTATTHVVGLRHIVKVTIRGLYKRGNTFWFAYPQGGRRFFVRLKTDDYVHAVQRASLTLRTPLVSTQPKEYAPISTSVPWATVAPNAAETAQRHRLGIRFLHSSLSPA